MEYTAAVTVIQKYIDSAFIFGISYLQNDQYRVGSTQSQKETNFEIGYLF
ncbi:MAG: hypothetical protein WA160_05735 [Pseudobdellovibrio sp.]